MDENAKLAREVKLWRANEGLTAEAAARILGIPKRTFEGVEQGRGFPYPLLLRVALQSKGSLPTRKDTSRVKSQPNQTRRKS